MDEKRLVWTEEERKKITDCNILSVWEAKCKSPETQDGKRQTYVFTVIDTKDWVIVVPVIKKEFVMVWQWRHGAKSLSLEFPGGVMEAGENPKEAAIRELAEETGYRAGKIEKMGEFFSNPAIMTNRVHFFLAEDLSGGGKQDLDENEYVETALVGIDEVTQNMGKAPYVHSLMGAALALYNQKKKGVN